MKKNIVIFLLFVAVFSLLGYIAYDNGLFDSFIKTEEKETTDKKEKEETKKETTNTNEGEVIEVTDERVLDAIDKIDSAINNYCGTYQTYLTEEKTTTKDINNQFAYETVMTKLIKTNNAPITKEEMDNAIDETFGKDYEFEHKTYSSCPQYDYNEQTENYTYVGSGCGGTCATNKLSKVAKAMLNGNKLEIYIRIVYSNPSLTVNGRIAFCKNSDLTDIVGYIMSDNLNDESQTNRLISKGSLYKLRFTNEDDNYVFTSSELQ